MSYDSREKVLHKLFGAAYQATHEEEYELAVEIGALAETFWERTDPVADRREFPPHSEAVDEDGTWEEMDDVEVADS